jgi:hypothetical protein
VAVPIVLEVDIPCTDGFKNKAMSDLKLELPPEVLALVGEKNLSVILDGVISVYPKFNVDMSTELTLHLMELLNKCKSVKHAKNTADISLLIVSKLFQVITRTAFVAVTAGVPAAVVDFGLIHLPQLYLAVYQAVREKKLTSKDYQEQRKAQYQRQQKRAAAKSAAAAPASTAKAAVATEDKPTSGKGCLCV